MNGKLLIYFSVLLILSSCSNKVKEQQDKIYSRHLQKHVALTIISTEIPKSKSDLNLLLLNDGQDMDKLRVKQVLDSLYSNKAIRPLVVVGIHAGDRLQEYGVSGQPDYQGNGSKADKYAMFIDNELYSFIKKKTGTRKFSSIAIAGSSLGGLSAFDIAWDHADKIDKVGVFSGSFWWRDADAGLPTYSDDKNRIIISKVRSSRKKPRLQYWFYAGGREETGDRDKDGIIDVIDDTKDLVTLIKSKKVCADSDIIYTEDKDGVHEYSSWSHWFPYFLQWAFGRK